MNSANPARPNFLIICCDHLRWDWLGCNGHPLVQTPQIDKLAASGANFQRAFSECPICVPARRILMTGRGPYGVHMNQNRDHQPFTEGPKLAEIFTRGGWQTFAAGKLHTAPPRNRLGFEDVQLNEEGRLEAGGARLDDYERWLRDHGLAHRAYTHGLGNNQYGLRLSPLPDEATTTAWTAQRAMEFIERRDPTRPFLLYVSFDKPHPPLTPPASFYELYRDATFPPPVIGDWVDRKCGPHQRRLRDANLHEGFQRQPGPTQQSLRGYAALITQIDSAIGTLLGTLREDRLLDDTWIVFTSDHGDQLFDHHLYAKGDLLHGSVRVPFIIRPPKAWTIQHGVAGRIDRAAPVGLADLLPTLTDAAGLTAPQDLDGQSLLPLLSSAQRADFRRYSFGNIGSHYGVTDGRFRYQWEATEGHELLFDQDADDRDCRDLADDPAHAPVVAELRQQLITWMAAHGDPHVVEGRLQLAAAPAATATLPDSASDHWGNRGRH